MGGLPPPTHTQGLEGVIVLWGLPVAAHGAASLTLSLSWWGEIPRAETVGSPNMVLTHGSPSHAALEDSGVGFSITLRFISLIQMVISPQINTRGMLAPTPERPEELSSHSCSSHRGTWCPLQGPKPGPAVS